MAMPPEPRLAALLDDPLTRLEDFPQHPSLRIPPLQDPKPPQASTRPLPLEPNARTDKHTHTGTVKLCGRMKALAEALPIHDAGPAITTSDTSGRGGLSGNLKADQRGHQPDLESGNRLKSIAPSSSLRKRKRTDDIEALGNFVQLPRPPPKQKAEKYPPFKPMTALNRLNEPPPNAALFPPITPSASQDATVGNILNASTAAETGLNITEENGITLKNHKSVASTRAATKKPTTLTRQKWTDAETDELLRGVARFGLGKWKKILNHPDFTFSTRTAVDLKDRFRTCCPVSFRRASKPVVAIEVAQNNEQLSSSEHINEANAKDDTTIIATHGSHTQSSKKRRPNQRRNPEDLARLGIVAPFAPNPKRRPRRCYTEEEDANLLKGYTLYGPQWATIQKDTTLDLERRRALDLRDRFRIRYPDLYAQAGFVLKPHERRKHATNSLPAEEELKQGFKAFLPPSVAVAALPSLIKPLTPPSSGSEQRMLETAESEDSEEDHNYHRGVLNNGNINDSRNPLEPAPSLQEDTATLFADWEDNTLPPLALTWEEMVARPIFDID